LHADAGLTAYPKPPEATPGMAWRRLASECQNDTGVSAQLERNVFLPHCSLSLQPTAGLPGERDLLHRSSFNNCASPHWYTSRNSPVLAACRHRSAPAPSSKAQSGVFVAGFTTMVLPVARHGATLCATRLSGKIERSNRRRSLPAGERRARPRWPSPLPNASRSSSSPCCRRASSAAAKKGRLGALYSASAKVTGLPASRSSSPRIPFFAVRCPARPLARGLRVDEGPCDALWKRRRVQWRWHASTSAAPPSGTRANSLPVNGLITGISDPVMTHSEPIKSRRLLPVFMR